MGWTPEQDAALRDLIVNKHLSPGYIVLKFGHLVGYRSRNALIGRASRIGIALSGHSYRKTYDWPPDRLQCLKSYYFGALGYGITDIARLMSMTEDQIKYGISRLRLAIARGEKSAATLAKRPARPKGARELLKGLTAPQPQNAPMDILGLKQDHCRAPHSEIGADMLYCGAQKVVGSYCAHHAAQFYIIP